MTSSFTARCQSCNTICHLPSLKARAVACDACARKRSVALNEARDTTPAWARIGLDYLPPVDKWEPRALEFTEERRAKGREVWRVVDVDCDPETGTRFLALDRSGTGTRIAVSEEQWDRAWNLPAGASSIGCEAVTEYSQLVELRLPRGSIVTPKPAKRPFAVGDRVVVKTLPNSPGLCDYRVEDGDAVVVRAYDDGEFQVCMLSAHRIDGETWNADETWTVRPLDMEHA